MAGNKVDVIVNFKAMTNDVVHQLDMVKKKLNSMNYDQTRRKRWMHSKNGTF